LVCLMKLKAPNPLPQGPGSATAVKGGTSQFNHCINELEIIQEFMQKDWIISLHGIVHKENVRANILEEHLNLIIVLLG